MPTNDIINISTTSTNQPTTNTPNLTALQASHTDICPHGLQRDLGLAVIGNHFGDLKGISVPPSTLGLGLRPTVSYYFYIKTPSETLTACTGNVGGIGDLKKSKIEAH